jgi:hypothetical protein
MTRYLSRRRWQLILLAALGATAALLLGHDAARTAGRSDPDRAALDRARATVRMVDDLYKGFVVHITATYVRAQEKTPAATVAKKVFKHMADKGWHTGRLVDATGTPFNEDNLPKTDFEKRAVARLKKGMDYFDEVGSRDGKPVLRAATRVPVVMKQCIACHEGTKMGDLLGALVYEVPIK